MFNVGFGELVFILGLGLLVLGPRKLPELARGIGRFMREFRRQSEDIRHTVEREFYKMDRELEEPLPKLGPPEGTFSAAPLHQAPPLPTEGQDPVADPDGNPYQAHPEPPPEALLASSPPFRGVAVGLGPEDEMLPAGDDAAAASSTGAAPVTAQAANDAAPANADRPTAGETDAVTKTSATS